MKKRVILLGATGSIGQSTLDVLDRNRDEFELVAVSVYSNIDGLNGVFEAFSPSAVAVGDASDRPAIESAAGDSKRVYSGADGLLAMIRETDADIVVNSIVGAAGLLPTIEAVRGGKSVALANKESLVVAGELVMAEIRKQGVDIYPIDSEHSAIWQCLAGENRERIGRIILTASGGPFRETPIDRLPRITVAEALDHPNWKMGDKITIDSATLMNKGFEVIETKWLFGLPASQITVIIHPQSIVHSMVEFIDGSIKAQMGVPDMKLPIQYALTYPDRKPGAIDNGDIFSGGLTFEEPDYTRFPCLKIAFGAMEACGTAPAVLNAANEIAVRAFLDERIRFTDIPALIDAALQEHEVRQNPALEDYLDADTWARETTEKRIYTHA